MANPDSVFAISPAKPGPVDVIKFFDPIDHQTYGNNCEAGFGVGEPSIAIDPAARTIDITFTLLPPPQICPLFFRPVSGLEGDFGPLPAGEWTYRALPYTTATFTVVPEPSSLSLILVGAALSAARGLGRRLKPPLRVLPRRGSMISPL
jgi:hypothetical protein